MGKVVLKTLIIIAIALFSVPVAVQWSHFPKTACIATCETIYPDP